ncbi:hypothetical protein N7532_006933 [Penicillium argentinense]|uniref:Uncharacterized protein n=1 Tax=Penicillium argentinense TaxID=1131581 RepID=A0A9W9KCF3_9EURO|nr:uncharacterized protein N7532_006933 [Penicillium argentinense]KAJ5099932.1 hypothetical protein N7532_006933 [Penicillium argentinense]
MTAELTREITLISVHVKRSFAQKIGLLVLSKFTAVALGCFAPGTPRIAKSNDRADRANSAREAELAAVVEM